MTEPKALQKIELTDVEREEYNKWKRTKGATLPVQSALRAYELFLSQYTCEEISRASGFPLGQVVDARIRYDWDTVRTEQMQLLYAKIEERALVARGHAVSHVSDLIAAATKLQGEGVKKFLVEGDPSALGFLELGTIKSFKEIVNLLVVLTQQNVSKSIPTSNKVKVEGKVEHVHKSEQNNSPAYDVLKEIEDAELTNEKN